MTKYDFNMEGSIFTLKDRAIFDGLKTPTTYQKDNIIYQQGDDADYIYYLKTGKVQIYIGSAAGTEKILAVFTGGSLFGKSSFFDRMPRASCAKALAKSEVICIDRAMMTGLIGRHPDFALELLEYLSKTIRLFSNQIENMSFSQADKRVARFIVSNAPGRGGRLAYTHEAIAGIVGASRVTVSKILSRFARAGWIEPKYKSIQVTNIAALTGFAFDD